MLKEVVVIEKNYVVKNALFLPAIMKKKTCK